LKASNEFKTERYFRQDYRICRINKMSC